MSTLSGKVLKIIEELATEIKQPWQMSLEEFQKDPYEGIVSGKPGYVVAYHKVTSEKNLPSILRNGLDPKMRSKHSEGPTTMAASNPNGYSEYGAAIAFRIPDDTPKSRVGENEYYYYIYNLVPPEDILFVDQTYDESSVSTSGRRLSFYRNNRYSARYWIAFVEEALEKGFPVPDHVREEYEKEKVSGEIER